ncbi:MAG: FapA family protein [Lachnospiraceae bacterium]|nr:FapA family protein [Lachnospiraceae bacterium]
MAGNNGADLFGEDIFKLLEQVQREQDRENSRKKAESKVQDKAALSSAIAESNAAAAANTESAMVAVDEMLSGISIEAEVQAIAERAEAEALAKKKSVDDYDRSVYGYPQLDEIKKGIDHGVDVSFYDDAALSFRQMREVRIGLEMGLDVSFYANKFYKDKQMREIRLGLMDGLDVSGYARFVYSTSDMEERRMKLVNDIYAKTPQTLDTERSDRDTGIKILIKEKQMKAYIRLSRPLPPDFNANTLDHLLELYNVVKGLKTEELFEDGEELVPGENYLVAEGIEGKPGIDGYYEYKVDGLEQTGPVFKEDGSIDYRATRRYSSVKAGDIVAIYHPAKSGEPGSTVTGIPIESSRGDDISKYRVDGIRLLEDGITYIAQKDGLVTLKNDTLSVQKHLELQGDVAYGSGNVAYDGTISINGSVRDNVIVEASGDIMINGFVEGARLKAGGNIVISKGVNGNEKGEIEAGGNVTCAFLENVGVTAGGSIECGYILNSEVNAKGHIKTDGRKSSICGGTVVAFAEIETAVLGSPAGVRTNIRLGEKINFSIRLGEVIKRRRQVEAAMNKQRTAMAEVLKKLGPMQGRQHPVFLKFQDVFDQQQKLLEGIKEEQAAIENEMADMSKKYINVDRKVYGHTYMMINGVSKIFENDEPGGRFYEDGGIIQN